MFTHFGMKKNWIEDILYLAGFEHSSVPAGRVFSQLKKDKSSLELSNILIYVP